MTDDSSELRAQATAQVRDAILASVALVTSNIDDIDIPPAVLLEGTDPELVCRVLAATVAAFLGATTGDGGRQVLIRVSRGAVEDPE